MKVSAAMTPLLEFLAFPSPQPVRPGGKPPCVRRRGQHAGQARACSPPNNGECKSANLNGFHGNLMAAVDKSMAWRLAPSSFDWVAMWLARMQSAEYRAF